MGSWGLFAVPTPLVIDSKGVEGWDSLRDESMHVWLLCKSQAGTETQSQCDREPDQAVPRNVPLMISQNMD